MSTLYFLRQPFTNDPKDTWRIASGRAFDFMPEADRMAVVPAASLADAQAEIARLRGALERCREAFDSCTPGDYSTGHVIHPYFDEDAVNAAQDLLDGLGI